VIYLSGELRQDKYFDNTGLTISDRRICDENSGELRNKSLNFGTKDILKTGTWNDWDTLRAQRPTKYKNNSRISSKLKGYSPLQVHRKLKDLNSAVGNYSYTNRQTV
jgi:hypothetical protein